LAAGKPSIRTMKKFSNTGLSDKSVIYLSFTRQDKGCNLCIHH
jgi:hypothetical protein